MGIFFQVISPPAPTAAVPVQPQREETPPVSSFDQSDDPDRLIREELGEISEATGKLICVTRVRHI